MIQLSKKSITLLASLMVIMGSSLSCSKREEVSVPSQEKARSSSLSLNSELDVEGGLRAASDVFSYKVVEKGTKLTPLFDLKEGTKVKVLALIRNRNGVSTKHPVIMSYADWTVSSGKLVSKGLPLNLPLGAELTVNEEGWYMYCFVGVTYHEANKSAEFCIEDNVVISPIAKKEVPMASVYTNTNANWTPLRVGEDAKGNKYFEATKTTRMKSRGVALAVDITSGLSDGHELTEFKIRSEKISFGGFYHNLDQVRVMQEPTYTNNPKYDNFFKYPSTYAQYKIKNGPLPVAPRGRYFCLFYGLLRDNSQEQSPYTIKINVDAKKNKITEVQCESKEYKIPLTPGYYYNINYTAEPRRVVGA